MPPRVRLNRAAVRALAMDAASREVAEATRLTQNRAKVLTPVDTGLLRSANFIRVRSLGKRVVGQVYNNTDYALPVHEGWSRVRPIYPIRGRALRFKVGGNIVIASVVKKPASYPGRPWLRRALFEVCGPRGYRLVGT
jgi:hypothetical protein